MNDFTTQDILVDLSHLRHCQKDNGLCVEMTGEYLENTLFQGVPGDDSKVREPPVSSFESLLFLHN